MSIRTLGTALLTTLLAAAAAPAALAASQTAYILGPGHHAATHEPAVTKLHKTHHVSLVTRPVAEPAAVVAEPLADQPVWDHMIELQVGGGTTVFIDPDTDYVNRDIGGIDEDHSWVKAQRLYRSLRAKGVQIIGGPEATAEHPEIQPRAILHIPNAPVAPAEPKPELMVRRD